MNQESIYHQVGGREKVNAMVEDFYQNVMANPSLSHFFENVDMAKQKEHQTNFLSFALGGPNQYTGRELAQAHTNLGSSHEHFDLIMGHLQDALRKHEFAPEHIANMMQHVEQYRSHIVSD